LTGPSAPANLTLMYDTVRWVLLVILFAGLFALWLWSRKQVAAQTISGGGNSSFKILQKKWVDQRTGICLVEAEDRKYLLAYTVGGGVSWQVLEKSAADVKPAPFVTPTVLPDPKR
jgi:flagellar biogenesis protein FliO